MSESKTPRTDDKAWHIEPNGKRGVSQWIDVDFARQLETELARAQADLGEALDYIQACFNPSEKRFLFDEGKDILIKHGRIK